jgi:hypothetical protein
LPALDVPPLSSVLLVGFDEQAATLPLASAVTKATWVNDFMTFLLAAEDELVQAEWRLVD